MMKVVVVVPLIIALAAAFPLGKREFFSNLEDSGLCSKMNCVPTGSRCTSYEVCNNCTTQINACWAVAYRQGNAAMCGCWNDFVNCIISNQCPNPLQSQEDCQSFFSSVNYPCPCGNVPPPPVNNICQFDTDYCDNNGICQKKQPAGAACVTIDGQGDCSTDYFETQLECVDGICTPFVRSGVNDGCTVTSDCEGSPSVQCVNGICAGVPQGGQCFETLQCDIGLYCSSGACVPRSQVGGPCDRERKCVQTAVCGYQDKCVTLFSQGVNSKCNETAECTLGLTCSDSVCINPPPPQPCNIDADCPNSRCACDFSGNQVCLSEGPVGYAGCTSAYTTFIKCAVANHCSLDHAGNYAPTSCLGRHCLNEAKCMLNCAMNHSSFPSSCLGDIPNCATPQVSNLRIN